MTSAAGLRRHIAPRAIAINLCLAVFSATAVFSAFELAARWAPPASDAGTQADYTEHDPLLGWRKKPRAHVAFRRGDYQINSHGLRDRERAHHAEAGTTRLLALGDSFVEGMSVRYEDSVTQRLETRLSQPACPVEVVNGGTVGYSTDQEYLFYVEQGWRYAPRVVLLFFYYNDVVYNGRADYARRPKPLLAFRAGQPYVKNAPVPQPGPSPASVVAARPRGHSAALAWVGDRLLRSAPRSYEQFAAFGLFAPLAASQPSAELAVFRPGPPHEASRAWEHTVAILRALAGQVRARGARLMVVYVPSRMEVCDGDWQLTRTRYRLGPGEWERDVVARRLREAAARIGIATLDLTGPLRANEHGLLGGPYHADGGHWNALGHRVAAREVARALSERGWLQPCRAAR